MSQDFGGPTGSSAVPTAEGSIYSEDAARGGPQQFNAWGPDGVLHRVTKAQTVVSEASTGTTRSNVTVTPSGWIKPVSLCSVCGRETVSNCLYRACARLRLMRRTTSSSGVAILLWTTTTTVLMD